MPRSDIIASASKQQQTAVLIKLGKITLPACMGFFISNWDQLYNNQRSDLVKWLMVTVSLAVKSVSEGTTLPV